MNTEIIAVRHGETEWNVIEKEQGHLDSKLSDNGIRQAEMLAKGLTDKNIDILISSDLGRALQTAEIMAKRLKLDIKTDSRLKERHLGIMQGMTQNEFSQKYPKEACAYNSGNPDYALPQGESIRQFYERCIESAEDIAARYPGKKVLVVVHGGTVCNFFYKATRTPLESPRYFSLFNASICSFTINNRNWFLNTWGDVSHLNGMRVLDDSQTSSNK
jgi:probable phosphoglycerate mutase